MTAGRRPKPTALKVLTGNPGKRALNKREPKPAPGSTEPPDWLRHRAKLLWKRVAPLVMGMKVLTPADVHSLALLCTAYAEYLDARDEVQKHGMTYESRHLQMDEAGHTVERIMIRPRPEVAIASDAWKRVYNMFQQFGLTPSSRSRLTVEDPDKDANPFEAWKRGQQAK